MIDDIYVCLSALENNKHICIVRERDMCSADIHYASVCIIKVTSTYIF